MKVQIVSNNNAVTIQHDNVFFNIMQLYAIHGPPHVRFLPDRGTSSFINK